MTPDEPSPFDSRSHAHVDTPAGNAALAAAMRELVDACVRTEIPEPDLAEVAAQVQALTDRLRTEQIDGPRNITAVHQGRLDDSGNPTVGARNPIAPPLDVEMCGDDRVRAVITLGAAYEGPPGCVHGGIVAALLDQIMGTVPWVAGSPGMTAYLHLNYRKPTRLGRELTIEAWLERKDGWKTFVNGSITDAEGTVTADAEGLFVTPRIARDRGALPHSDSGTTVRGRG